MKLLKIVSIAVLGSSLLFGGAAMAQTAAAKPAAAAGKTAATPDPVEIKLERRKITMVNGKEVPAEATVAKPGDVLEEVVTYTNKSKNSVTKLEATLPVPSNTEFVMASVNPAGAKASIDGKLFSDIPLKRVVKQANGVEVEKAIPLTEYRFLRWYPGELAAGKSLVFSARFKVADK